MYNPTDELNKASNVLLSAEISLNSITVQLEEIERQIALLNYTEITLKENISFLKRNHIITSLWEYLKSKLELRAVLNKQALLRIDRQRCSKTQKKYEEDYEIAKKNYQLIYERISNPNSNIIYAIFRGKNGQE
jgi:hypothetical protein